MKGAASAVVLFGLLTVAFSGCIVPKDDNAVAAAAVTSGAAPVGDNQTTDGNKTVNAAPVLVVEIFDNGTLLVAVDGIVNASAGVDLSFEAKNSTDAEGHNLTFAWDFGDGNTSAGSNATHSYATAGNYTLNVTATDEEGATANTSIPLVVASSGPASGTFVRTDSQAFSGTVTLAVQGASCGTGVGLPTHTWTIPSQEADGTMVKAVKFVVTLTPGTTHVDAAFQILDPAGAVIESVDDGFQGAESVTVEGDFLPGDYTIKNTTCTAVMGSYTIQADADLVAM